MFDRVLISPVIFSNVADLQPSAYNFTKRWTSSHVFFKDFGNLATYLKEQLWMVASRETDVMKSAVKIYDT